MERLQAGELRQLDIFQRQFPHALSGGCKNRIADGRGDCGCAAFADAAPFLAARERQIDLDRGRIGEADDFVIVEIRLLDAPTASAS